ncbi:uncharacterized protein VTP21DRAFT_10152 [Calcarisporiella thermophila]|uniref:uncharacterized protein n=1 Tax=Calcarisporiella thermophila TaxID=911321 RepID=UPI003743FA71
MSIPRCSWGLWWGLAHFISPSHASPPRLLGHNHLLPVDYSSFWWKLTVMIILVCMGGIFAGLTLALMGIDSTHIQILAQSGELRDRQHAEKILSLLRRGKHWILVTLLLSNVIVNETLPIVLDSIFSGGWPAVLISTALIVIFGDYAMLLTLTFLFFLSSPAICVRHGLVIGSFFFWFVLILMYLLYPIAYPIALLLDYCLGEDRGITYRKAELKTLVSLHQGDNDNFEGLTEDEVTIIGAVLDLREKPVSAVMTPLEDVFTLSTDHILDEQTLYRILLAGYSRIPVYAPPGKTNFVGMLLVKQLITCDPEDRLPVSAFHLSTLPAMPSHTSCLDVLNFFQEGRSHMVLVYDPSDPECKPLGVITLEDVIEELIGEEIIDETDEPLMRSPSSHPPLVHKKVKVIRKPFKLPGSPRLHPLFDVHKWRAQFQSQQGHLLHLRPSSDNIPRDTNTALIKKDAPRSNHIGYGTLNEEREPPLRQSHIPQEEVENGIGEGLRKSFMGENPRRS